MASSTTDRNLLFGILALQMDFISRDELIEAMNAWVLEKSKPLSEVLRARRALAEDELKLLEQVVEKHLAKHGFDPQRSLAAVAPADHVLAGLRQLGDHDVAASIMLIPPNPARDHFATQVP